MIVLTILIIYNGLRVPDAIIPASIAHRVLRSGLLSRICLQIYQKGRSSLGSPEGVNWSTGAGEEANGSTPAGAEEPPLD